MVRGSSEGRLKCVLVAQTRRSPVTTDQFTLGHFYHEPSDPAHLVVTTWPHLLGKLTQCIAVVALYVSGNSQRFF